MVPVISDKPSHFLDLGLVTIGTSCRIFVNSILRCSEKNKGLIEDAVVLFDGSDIEQESPRY